VYGQAPYPQVYGQAPYPQVYGQAPYPPPPAGYPPPGYPAYAVAPKSPGLALLASFFIPGLGSMINGEVGKGVAILVGYLVSAALTLVVVGYVGMLAFWLWGMVDGYRGAQRWNARHGIYS
jgi:TM2 domain-containing membrane protein YozV